MLQRTEHNVHGSTAQLNRDRCTEADKISTVRRKYLQHVVVAVHARVVHHRPAKRLDLQGDDSVREGPQACANQQQHCARTGGAEHRQRFMSRRGSERVRH